jgi:co-chaperonin GroES (HSP10)
MIPTNGNIIVKFEHNKNDGAVKQANGLYIPERYLIEGDDEQAQAAYGVTTNRKLINPQICTVIENNQAYYNFISEKYPEPERTMELKRMNIIPKGSRVFVYYGAYEIANFIDDDMALIPASTVLFILDPIQCMPGTYLGDEVYAEGPKTESGIWTTPIAETKDGVKIIITHLPANNNPLIKVGSAVITIDSFQYDLEIEGKKHIKLNESQIIGLETEDGVIPLGDRVLVEYLPDFDLAERTAENDKRSAQRDFIDKSGLHLGENYAKGIDENYLDVKEPKTTRAKIISIGAGVKRGFKVGDNLLIHRNFGCKMLNGQWILNK